MSVETIHAAELAAISDDYDKTVGYPTYDFTRAFAYGGLLLENEIYWAMRSTDVEYMTGTTLDAFVWQRKGLTRKSGSSATATLTCTVVSGKKATIKAGQRFVTAQGLYFEANVKKTVSNGGTIEVTAAEEGADYNVEAGTITTICSSVTYLSSVTNTAQAVGGADAEDDDDLRARYYEAVKAMANGSNVGQMETWAKNIQGVGAAKCIPCVDSTLTAKAGECVILLTDTECNPANATLIKEVQDTIDPNINGDGSGLAPCGCVVTVKAPKQFKVTVGGTYTGIADPADVQEALDEFLDSIALQTYTISYGKIMRAVLDLDGVEDCTLTVNNKQANVAMTQYTVPKLVYKVEHNTALEG